MGPAADAAVRLLFVCTGNMCRSAAAERILATWTAGADAPVAVRSAGTRALTGRPLHPRTLRALQPHSIDAGRFSSRRLTEADVDWADVVLTMTSAHREEVLAVSPRGLQKSFTLLEAAALCAAISPDGLPPAPGRRGEVLAEALRQTRLRYARAQGPDFDVPDPIDGPEEMHAEVVQRIAAALDVIASALDSGTSAAKTGPMRRLPPVPRRS